MIEDARARQRRHRRTGAVLLAAAVAAGALLAGLTGGGGGAGAGRNAAGQPSRQGPGAGPAQASASRVGRPQGAVLRLARGHTSGRFSVSAIPGHEWEVLTTAPANVHLQAHAVTSHGERLDLLYGTRSEGCSAHEGRIRCFSRFAIGANVRPATWTVVVNKTSVPAAIVDMQVTFPPLH